MPQWSKVSRIPNKNDSKEIEKLFSVEYLGNSRIDGYPFFKIKRNHQQWNHMRDCFEIHLVSALEDNIASNMGIAAGEKDYFLIKIVEIKMNYDQYIRGEKLKKIDIYL